MIDGRYQSFIIEHADGDMVYFQAMVRAGAAPLAAEYDSKTLAFIGASSTDEASSRVQMMVSLLRTMERDDALPLIEEALASPHFYTRWHIMRELLAMDAEAALPPLRRMAAKRSRIPRSAPPPRQTLDLFFDGRGGRRPARETMHAAPDRRRDRARGSSSPSWSRCSRPAISTARTRTISPPGASQLKKLANDRTFLADMMIAELKQRCDGQVRDNQYSAQVVMLHGRSPKFIMRANFWPALKDSVIRHQRHRSLLLRRAARP